MAERERRLIIEPAEKAPEATPDQDVVEETLLSQEEEAALAHGSVEKIYRRGSILGGAEEELLSQAEEAALDDGAVDRIATKRMPARPPAGRESA